MIPASRERQRRGAPRAERRTERSVVNPMPEPGVQITASYCYIPPRKLLIGRNCTAALASQQCSQDEQWR